MSGIGHTDREIAADSILYNENIYMMVGNAQNREPSV